MQKVAHLTSAHPRFDTRIFLKMCSSLARANIDTSLIVADGLGDALVNGVKIFDVGARAGGRLSRITKTVRQVYRKAAELDADLYHLHDPELLPVSLRLKRSGKRVIFDAHEDLPKQIMSKPYLNLPSRHGLSFLVTRFEKWVCSRLDAIVAATPCIRDKFLRINPKTIDINNFPLLEELDGESAWSEKAREVAYIGAIGEIRGIQQMVEALEFTNGVRLNLGGKFYDPPMAARIHGLNAWSLVNELGYLSREEVKSVLRQSMAGLVTFLPAPNHIDAQPTKIFEYMSASLPVIASDFPLWRQIVVENNCGVCVDPLNPRAIGSAIQYLVDTPVEAEKMGRNGYRAVKEKFNWETEERKLHELYEGLLI